MNSCCVAYRKGEVSEPTGGSNYVERATPLAGSGIPYHVRLPPTAPTGEEAKSADVYSDQESYRAATSYDEHQTTLRQLENERWIARNEQRQIAAAVYRKSMREKTISETMNQEITRVPTNVDQSKANAVSAEQQRVSGIDSDTAGANEHELAEAGKADLSKNTGLAVPLPGQNDDDHGKVNDMINTDDVAADDGTPLAETAGDECNTASNTGQPPATHRVDVPGDEESIVVREVSDDTREPADNSREGCSDVKTFVVETGSSMAVVGGEKIQGSEVEVAEETNNVEAAFEEAGDEGGIHIELSSDNV